MVARHAGQSLSGLARRKALSRALPLPALLVTTTRHLQVKDAPGTFPEFGLCMIFYLSRLVSGASSMDLRSINLTSAHNAQFAGVEIPRASPRLTIRPLRKFISVALPRTRSYVSNENWLGMLPASWSTVAWTSPANCTPSATYSASVRCCRHRFACTAPAHGTAGVDA